jgi:tRNA threonylcarbamoyl adenosine modification protein YeaZ
MPNLAPSQLSSDPCSLLGISCDAKGVEVSAALFDFADSPHPSIFVSARQDGQGSSSDAALSLVDEVLGNFQRSRPHSMIACSGTPKDWLSGVVFNAGPGGFTAVRGACALAQGLGFGWHKPVAGISSLEAWAESVAIQRCEYIPEGQCEEVLALLDARMGEVYAGHFRFEPGRDKVCSLQLLSEAVLAPDLIPYWVQSTRANLASAGGYAQMLKDELRDELRDEVGVILSPNGMCAEAWFCGDFQTSFPTLRGVLEAMNWRALECLDLTTGRLSSKSLLRLAFSKREVAFQSPSEVAPHYVRNKVALNSLEQQALRERNRGSLPQSSFD